VDGLSAIYREHVGYVSGSLQRLGAPAGDLADLTHDVFLTAQVRFSTYDPARPIRPWLFGIALRLMANARTSARARLEQVGELPPRPSDEPGPDAQFERKQTSQRVRSMLLRLSEEKRAVLIMHDLDGHPAPEIAHVLGIPTNTGYSRLRLARAEFTRLLREEPS
jgi:RNA polymerase sigma-70 factor (ECF subfamily)